MAVPKLTKLEMRVMTRSGRKGRRRFARFRSRFPSRTVPRTPPCRPWSIGSKRKRRFGA